MATMPAPFQNQEPMGGLNGSIPLSAVTQQTQQHSSPLSTVMNVMQIRRMQDEARERREEQERTRAIQETLAQYPDSLDDGLVELARKGYTLEALELAETIGTTRKKAIDFSIAQLDHAGKVMDYAGRLSAAVRDQPSWDVFRGWVLDQQPALEAFLPEQYSPDALERFREMHLTAEQLRQKQKDALDRVLKGDWVGAVNRELSMADSQEQWAGVKRGYQMMGMPKHLLDLVPDTFTEQAREQAYWDSMTPKEQEAASGEKTQATEQRALTAFATKRGKASADELTYDEYLQFRKEFGQADDRPRVSVTLTPDQRESVESMAQQLVDGNVVPSMLSKRGNYNDILARANELSKAQTGRSYNAAKAEMEFWSAKRWATTMNGNQMVRYTALAESVVSTIDEVQQLADLMKQGGVQRYNSVKRSTILQVYGNTPQSQLAARYIGALNTLKEEFANLAQGGFAPTESAWRLANEQINGDFGVKDMTAALGEVKRLINFRTAAFQNVRPRSPYDEPQTSGVGGHGAAPPAAGGGPTTVTFRGKDGKTKTATFPTPAAADEFKRRMGIQ